MNVQSNRIEVFKGVQVCLIGEQCSVEMSNGVELKPL